jgi:Spy/CpxP family protein refolding chaperone
MRKSKDSLFSLIGKAQPEDSLVQQLAGQIGEKQKALDLQTFRYFSDLRKLCRPDQQAKYDTLMSRMFKRMGRKGGK